MQSVTAVQPEVVAIINLVLSDQAGTGAGRVHAVYHHRPCGGRRQDMADTPDTADTAAKPVLAVDLDEGAAVFIYIPGARPHSTANV